MGAWGGVSGENAIVIGCRPGLVPMSRAVEVRELRRSPTPMQPIGITCKPLICFTIKAKTNQYLVFIGKKSILIGFRQTARDHSVLICEMFIQSECMFMVSSRSTRSA